MIIISFNKVNNILKIILLCFFKTKFKDKYIYYNNIGKELPNLIKLIFLKLLKGIFF